MYVSGNPKTKKMLKDMVASGRPVYIKSVSLHPEPTSGDMSVEGPHYPQPHAWYARVRVKDGVIVKVIS